LGAHRSLLLRIHLVAAMHEQVGNLIVDQGESLQLARRASTT